MIDHFHNVSFYRSFYDINQLLKTRLPSIPVVAITGRSNSGKSSLINALCNQKNLALTSSMPGKTRSINYYYVPAYKNTYNEFFLVDLPGYGFAKISKKESQQLHLLIDQFLAKAPNIKLILLIMDARRELEKEEESIINYCRDHNKNFLLLRSKWDKLNQKEKNHLLENWKKNLFLSEKIITVSSIKKINLDLLIQKIINTVFLENKTIQ